MAYRDRDGVLRQQISVDDVRRTVSFFGSTAGEGGWRIAIVDAVDELHRDEVGAVEGATVEDPDHVRMLEARVRLRLALEAGERLRVGL